MAKPIDVSIVVNTRQGVAELVKFLGYTQQTTKAVKDLNNATAKTQGAAVGMGRGLLHGIGAFYIYHRALTLSTDLLKRGIKGAMDYQSAITQLGLVTKTAGHELNALGDIAVRVSNKLGPLDLLDVMKGMNILYRMPGMSPARLAAGIEPISTAVSNLTEISGTPPEELYRAFARTLGAAGGARDMPSMLATARAMHSLTFAYGAERPTQMLGNMTSAMSLAHAAGLSPEAIATFAAIRAVMPTEGRSSAGRDVFRFLQDIVVMGQKGFGKQGARAQAAAQSLGLVDASGRSRFIDPATQKLDPLAFTRALTEKLSGMGLSERVATTRRLFPEATAQRLTLMLTENFDFLKEINRVLKEARTPEEIAQILLGTPRGAFNQMSENFNNFLMRLWMRANPFMQKAFSGVGGTFERGEKAVRRSPALGTSILGAMGGSALGLGAYTLGTFGSGAGGAIGLASGALMFGGQALMMAAMIAAVVGGGILAYQSSHWFRESVDSLTKLMVRLFSEVYTRVSSHWDSIKWGLGVVGKLGLAMIGRGPFILDTPGTEELVGPTIPDSLMAKRRYKDWMSIYRKQIKQGTLAEHYGPTPFRDDPSPAGDAPHTSKHSTSGVREVVTLRKVGELFAQQFNPMMESVIKGTTPNSGALSRSARGW